MAGSPLDELDLRGLLADGLQDLGDRLDGGVLPALYRAASLPTTTIRQELEAAGLPYTDPQAGRVPDRAALDVAAERLIGLAGRKAAVRGAAGALGGLPMLAPEAAAGLVQGLRLAQRLAVLYGHDPETDRGKLLMTRALSRAWKVDLPVDGVLGTNLRQLPDVVRSRLSGPRPEAMAVARTLAGQVLVLAGARLSRVVPGLGTTVGAISARRELRSQGLAMKAVFERAWEGDLLPGGPGQDGAILDAEELR
ncbi:EcsC family protein [Myxococcota bacterium]|nr:EcsC family protein [Myxococcota bacterium]